MPTERALLAGNHNTLWFGATRAAELERGRIVRSLGDHAHFKTPWRDALDTNRGRSRTRRDHLELMRRSEPVMVSFPRRP